MTKNQSSDDAQRVKKCYTSPAIVILHFNSEPLCASSFGGTSSENDWEEL